MTVQAKIEPPQTAQDRSDRRRPGLGDLRARAAVGIPGIAGFLFFAGRSLLRRALAPASGERRRDAPGEAAPDAPALAPGHYAIETLPSPSPGARSILAAVDLSAPLVEVAGDRPPAGKAAGRLTDAPAPSVRLDDPGRIGTDITG